MPNFTPDQIQMLRDDRFHIAAQEIEKIQAAMADDIRALGWAVAVHNDYRLNGIPHTFWLFTKGNLCIKGEGLTDAEALNIVRQQIAAMNQ